MLPFTSLAASRSPTRGGAGFRTSYHVDWKKCAYAAADIGYFHAYYRQRDSCGVRTALRVLNVTGRQALRGTVLNVVQVAPGWFGEGDDYFYVDGEKKPSIEGTGTEDYFNDAWSLRVAEGPYIGVTVADGNGYWSAAERLSLARAGSDPFQRSFRFVIEHYGWTYNNDGTVRSGFEERPTFSAAWRSGIRRASANEIARGPVWASPAAAR